MFETKLQTLSGVSESLLVTLYLRAMESQRPDALLKDERAVSLVKRIREGGGYDFSRIQLLHLNEANKLVIILRNRQFDRATRDFLVRHPDGVVVHIGCGLDTRFERLGCNQPDNGQVEWYDLDFPDIVELRRKLIGDEGKRYHLLGCSALEETWLEALSAHPDRPIFFLAEGVFMYLEGAQVRWLVLALRNRFPGAELVFDAYSPSHAFFHNLQTSNSQINIRVRWGIWRGQEIERWAKGIRLLDEWGYLDDKDAGWPTFAGCVPLKLCSGRCVFITSSLAR